MQVSSSKSFSMRIGLSYRNLISSPNPKPFSVKAFSKFRLLPNNESRSRSLLANSTKIDPKS